MKRVRVEPTAGTRLAENKDAAASMRQDIILPALSRGEKVEFDFARVDVATQSYVHALIAEAIRRYGDRSFDLLEFKNASPGVRNIVTTVFEYTMLAEETAREAAVAQVDD